MPLSGNVYQLNTIPTYLGISIVKSCLAKQQFHFGSIEFASNCLRTLYWCGIIKNSSRPKEREHKTGPIVTTAFSPQIVQIM